MANIVKYETDTGLVELDNETIKKYLVSGSAEKISDREIKLFTELCKARGLNPYLREAYLVKYGTSPAEIVVGKDVFLKRARNNPNFRGFKAGILVLNGSGKLENRMGTFYIKNKEKLVGGFSEVYIKGWDIPLSHSVSFDEYFKNSPTWKDKPATMIRKVALVQALREAFPEDFQAMYSEEEMPVDESKLPREAVEIEAVEVEYKGLPKSAAQKKEFSRRLNEIFTIAKEKKYENTTISNFIKDAYGKDSSGELTFEELAELKEFMSGKKLEEETEPPKDITEDAEYEVVDDVDMQMDMDQELPWD